jgi:uncharacterized protein YndB with AHSA1/START domain
MPELIEVSRLIPASAETIWSIVTDLKRLPDWLPVKADLEFPDGTVAAPGVRIKVERESALGRVHLEQHFQRLEQPRLIAWSHHHETVGGKPVTQIKEFTTEMLLERASEQQTKMTVRSRWTSVGLMGVVANSLLKPRLKHECELALQNIERLATASPSPAPP